MNGLRVGSPGHMRCLQLNRVAGVACILLAALLTLLQHGHSAGLRRSHGHRAADEHVDNHARTLRAAACQLIQGSQGALDAAPCQAA